MYTTTLIAAALATLAVASPVATTASPKRGTFQITNFVFGCTTTCDWSFDVTNAYNNPPSHPSFTKPVHCKGSKGTNTAFSPSTCGAINSTRHVSAYIDNDNQLQLQYQVNVPSTDPAFPGATYWFEGNRTVGAATGYHPSPKKFAVPETRAFAIA